MPTDPDPSHYTVRLRPQVGGELRAQVIRGAPNLLVLLPSEIPFGRMQVLLDGPGGTSLPAEVRVVRSAFGFFSSSGSGLGPAVAQVVRPDFTQALNRLNDPARPGDYVTLWGTGLGGARAPDVVVEIGGIALTPAYAGPAPGVPGLDQVNVLLPAEAPRGCYTSVVLRVADAISNEVMISTSGQPGPCEHPFGLKEPELLALDQGQSVPLATARLRSEIMSPPPPDPPQNLYTRYETGAVEFLRRNAEQISSLAQPLVAESQYFSCRLQNPTQVSLLIQGERIDPGTLTIAGAGKSLELAPDAILPVFRNALPVPSGVPSSPDLPPPFFITGSWRLTATGGQMFGPFEATLNLPPPVRWTNRASFAGIARTQDQVVTWAAQGHSLTDVMTVTVSSVGYLDSSTEQPDAGSVVCTAPATAGQLTIPSNLLRRIPAAPLVNGVSLATIQLRLSLLPSQRMRFEIPLTAGGSQRGLLDYLFSESLRIVIQ